MADSSYSEQSSFDTSKYTLQFFQRDVQLSILFTRDSILHILLHVSGTQCSITLFFYLWCCFEVSGS